MVKRKHKASASHGRLSLLCSMILCMLLLLLQGCGDLTPCEGNIGPYTMDPNGTSCTHRCQCNTLAYEGDCVDGKCASLKREPCTAKGQKRNCLLPKTPDRKCDLGVQTCQPEELRNEKRWGDCGPFQVVEREDTVELCFDGLDNDCDGKVDLGDPDCAKFCRPGSKEPCYTGSDGTLNVGECKAGVRVCEENHEWGPCKGEITPQEEICGDGKDNNCDEQVDEGCEKFCTLGVKEICYSGVSGTLNVGECKAGIRTCQTDGRWGACEWEITPQEEICGDGKDNNCNGAIDEGCPCNYLDKPHGVCKDAKRDDKGNCSKPADYNENEICNDKDSNCDRVIDEGCYCVFGATRGCGMDVGTCQKGRQSCEVNGKWGTLCEGEIKPTDEICDGKDNNCNGVIDEGCPCHYLDKPHGVCKDLKRDPFGNCPKPADYSETEICDGKDNNCDGVIDDGCCPMTCISDADCVNCGANQQVCLKGKCGICPTGQTDCTGVCRNLSTDPDNCGACDNKCPAEHICCSAVCRNLQTDANNCGACGNKCTGVKNCVKGSCACPSGQSDCSNICVNLINDVNNCGACGNKCTGVKNCVKGSCACPSGQSDCSNICVNLINDVDNCGACGNKCAGGKSCVNGKCDCPSGQSDCSGTCANINIDANNCGACGNKCTGGETCCSGVCLNLQTDFNNCGACGNKCTGGKSCVNGKCACPTGQSDCSGICRNLHTDDNNCGICVNKCASSQSCTIGKCLYPLEVYISSGSFTMSSPLGELGRADVRENPQRMVHITRSFVIGKYEVTQGEFESLMGYNPLYFKNCGANCPVEQVNWHEALAYLNALSRNRGLEECFDCTGSGSSVSCSVKTQYSGQNYYNCKGYRLPTEAEWEYAYRVGTNTAFYNGAITQTGCNPLDPNLDKIGWYCGNSGSKTHPVGGKQANAWGLYDMAGNVREWVYDRYQDSYNNLPTTDPVGPSTGSIRVFRGGSYASYALICRAAFRDGSTPTSRTRDLGLRFLRSI